jgi:hypothetical protein
MWQIAGNLAVAIVVAALTVQLSLRRFYREKWWERRLDAYTRVIEALHHMVRSLDLDWKHEVEKADYNEAYRKTLTEKAQAGWAEIRKAIDMGELLLSAEALAELDRIMKETDKFSPDANSYFEYIDGTLFEVRECLKKLVPLAKNDLRLNPGWVDRWKTTLSRHKP